MEFAHAERLGQQGGAWMSLDEFQDRLVGAARGDQHGYFRAQHAQARQGCRTPQSGHVDIQNHHIGPEAAFESGQGLFTTHGRGDPVTHGLQDRLDGTVDQLVVVHH